MRTAGTDRAVRVELSVGDWERLSSVIDGLPDNSVVEVHHEPGSVAIVAVGAGARMRVSRNPRSDEGADSGVAAFPGAVAAAGFRHACDSAGDATLVLRAGRVGVESAVGLTTWNQVEPGSVQPPLGAGISTVAANPRDVYRCLLDVCVPPHATHEPGRFGLHLCWQSDCLTLTTRWPDGATVSSSTGAHADGAAGRSVFAGPVATVLRSIRSDEVTITLTDDQRLRFTGGDTDALIDADGSCTDWRSVIAAHDPRLVGDDRYVFEGIDPSRLGPYSDDGFRITIHPGHSHITAALGFTAGGADRAEIDGWIRGNQHQVRHGRMSREGSRVWVETDVLEGGELVEALERLGEDTFVLAEHHAPRSWNLQHTGDI